MSAYRILALPAEALWLAGDAIKRTGAAVDDVGELVSAAGFAANTAAGHLGTVLEQLQERLS